jgi:MYXO-CTERM domain-containing protein
VDGGSLDGVTVSFPENSLAQRVTAVVSDVDPNSLPFFPEGAVLATFNLGPAKTTFSDAVDVTVPLEVGAADVGDIAVFNYDAEAQAWFETGISRVRVLENPARVAFKTSHFSTFAVIDEGREQPEPPMSCFDNGTAKQTRAGGDVMVLGGLALALIAARRRRS